MSSFDATHMLRDLDRKLKKVEKSASIGLGKTGKRMHERALVNVPQPGGSPYYADHPWAEGGLKANLFLLPVKKDGDTIYVTVASDQPPAGGLTKRGRIIQSAYGEAWDEGTREDGKFAPYMRDSVEQSMDVFESEMDAVMEEFAN